MGEHGKNSWQDNIRDLELMENAFNGKLVFIDKVYTGAEQLTMSVIDRCRETMMQLNQSAHAFNLKVDSLDKDIPDHIQTELSNMRASIKESLDDATRKLSTILGWVPPGITSRRTDQ